MRSWSFVFVAAFYVACSDEGATNGRPSGAGGKTNTSTTTAGGASSGSGGTSASTGNTAGTSTGSNTTTTNTTSGTGGSSSTSGGGAGASGGSGGTSGATGGKAGASGSGGAGGGHPGPCGNLPEWMRGAAYKKGEIVWYLDKLYECLADHNPATDPTVSTFYWKPFQCPDGGIVDAGMEAAPPDPGPLSGGGKACMDTDPVHSGRSTYYELLQPGVPARSGTCSYDLRQIPQPPCWVAMNQTRFAASKDCGACVKITGPNGASIQARVVDLCPAGSLHCNEMEHIDINTRPGCFYAIGGTDQAGLANITWNYVPCTVTGNVQILAQPGSMGCNSRMTITNHRYRVAKVELLLADGTYKNLTRNGDNVFVIDSIISPSCQALGPFRIRVTDIYGHWVENRITLTPGQASDLGSQFPACPGGT